MEEQKKERTTVYFGLIYTNKKGGLVKEEKVAKRRKQVGIWKTEGVSHIPTR